MPKVTPLLQISHFAISLHLLIIDYITKYRKVVKVKSPSQVMMVSDSFGNSARKNKVGAGGPAMAFRFHPQCNAAMNYFEDFARHNDGLNSAMVDGHVQYFNRSQWQYATKVWEDPYFDWARRH